MSLRLEAVDRLFDRLAATYGRDWFGMWAGVDSTAVKSLWSHELSPFADRLDAIAWALENLPPRCPNAIEFRQLCKQAPRPNFSQLDAPKADPQLVDSELLKMASTVFKSTDRVSDRVDFKGWARALKKRHESGENLNTIQVEAYQKALNIGSKSSDRHLSLAEAI